MKGSLKTLHNDKTDFNNWSDPKYKVPRRKITNYKLTKKDTPKQVLEAPSQLSEEIDILRRKIKDGYPLLSRKEVRNFRLPFHESLLLNLKEDGFIATYQLIKDLIDLDEEWHRQKGKQSSGQNRLFLKSNITTLNCLSNGLTKAEVAKREGKKTQEAKSLLNLAILISFPDKKSWHWIAHELYEQCMEIVNSHSIAVDKELEATAKHLYANFLLDILNDPKRARIIVQESMKLSIGKFWNVSELTGKENDILYFESCLLLHRIFLALANEAKGSDVEEAIQLCRHSLHWAKQINSNSAEAMALMNLVTIYITAGNLSPVPGHLEQYMKLCVDQENIQGLCEGYIMKATYHELTENDELAVKCLEELLTMAEINNIMKMTAIAHHKLATFYLMRGKEKNVKQHAIQAYGCYVKLNSKLEMEETRCLTGITQAQEIMAQYLHLLLDAESTDNVEFKILMWWKSLHIPFFTNVKLLQPEADTNTLLKDRLETVIIEERISNRRKRLELTNSAVMSTSQMTIKRIASSTSSIASRLNRGTIIV